MIFVVHTKEEPEHPLYLVGQPEEATVADILNLAKVYLNAETAWKIENIDLGTEWQLKGNEWVQTVEPAVKDGKYPLFDF